MSILHLLQNNIREVKLTLQKLNGERHRQVVIFVAIVGDGHRQLPQISLLGGDIHHLVFTVKGY